MAIMKCTFSLTVQEGAVKDTVSPLVEEAI